MQRNHSQALPPPVRRSLSRLFTSLPSLFKVNYYLSYFLALWNQDCSEKCFWKRLFLFSDKILFKVPIHNYRGIDFVNVCRIVMWIGVRISSCLVAEKILEVGQKIDDSDFWRLDLNSWPSFYLVEFHFCIYFEQFGANFVFEKVMHAVFDALRRLEWNRYLQNA